MSQNPYANLSGEFLDTQPQRTSLLAVFSLILGIVGVVPCVCMAPGSGALAVILGGAALLFIGRERGRLRGTGLAASGIVLGLLVSVVQVVMLVSSFQMQRGYKQMASLGDAALVAMQKGDLQGARKSFPAATDAVLTDQMMTDFVSAYQAELGNYKGFPDSPLAIITGWMESAQGFSSLQGPQNDIFPYPGRFDRGSSLVVIGFDSQAVGNPRPTPGSGIDLPPSNLLILTPGGKAIWLIDPNSDAGKAIKGGPPVKALPKPPAAPTPPVQAPPAREAVPEPAPADPESPR